MMDGSIDRSRKKTIFGKMGKKREPICSLKSTHCLKIPLRSTEQIYLIFLVPVIIGCCIYVVNFAADLVVAIQHFREGNPLWGGSTIALMYAPAVAYFALTVSRPDWWMTEDDKLTDGVLTWFAMQIFQLLAFPMFALYRYAELIVLAVDATMLSGDERTKTLNIAAAPAAIELYFFLQAWFQAAPQAVFQTHLMFREYTLERTHQTVVVHMVCILMSIVVLAMETASFQRFESQRINGRKLPWAMWLKKYRIGQEIGSKVEKKPLQLEPETELRNSVMPLINPEDGATVQDEEDEEEARNEDGKTTPEDIEKSQINFVRRISMTPPLPPKNAHVKPPPTPIRGITSVPSLPVPEMPAPPRPDSIVRDNGTSALDQQRVDVAESSGIIGTEGETLTTGTKKWHNFRVPRRKYCLKGLDEDDPVGKFVAFLWWFFFITSRVFSIAIFYEFHPIWLIGILLFHYLLVLIYLFYHAKYYDVTNFFVTLWLGLVYIFSAIEYRVKFKFADISLLAYYTFVIIQNSIMTVTWFILDDWSGFWYTFMFFAIFLGMVLCIMSAGVYNVLLKPKKRRIYAS